MPTLGILSDTHIPQRLPALPAGVASVFRGVDLIAHAGDINQLWVLDELRRIAPTVAVAGNADLFGTGLPARRVIDIGGRRIGLTHGHGSWPRYLGRKFVEVFRFDDEFYRRGVRAEFAGERVEAIVFGHTHRPCHLVIDDVLLFNPGPVAPNYYVTTRPQIGLLHVGSSGLRAEVIEL
jgi:hypothetical protein